MKFRRKSRNSSKTISLKENRESVASQINAQERIDAIRKSSSPQTGSFFDYFSDMHSYPDQIELRKVHSGLSGPEQDAQNIRRYFQIALQRFDPNEPE